MMSQVKISVEPSITGPTRFPFSSIPRSSMIMAFVGGTEEEQNTDSIRNHNTEQFFFDNEETWAPTSGL